tara:strand:- start:1284 stop:1433 length:150 start_codon:yes stop_codon:yes gene_type:complete
MKKLERAIGESKRIAIKKASEENGRRTKVYPVDKAEKVLRPRKPVSHFV